MSFKKNDSGCYLLTGAVEISGKAKYKMMSVSFHLMDRVNTRERTSQKPPCRTGMAEQVAT